MYFLYVWKYSLNSTVLHPGRPGSSATPLWEPKMWQSFVTEQRNWTNQKRTTKSEDVSTRLFIKIRNIQLFRGYFRAELISKYYHHLSGNKPDPSCPTADDISRIQQRIFLIYIAYFCSFQAAKNNMLLTWSSQDFQKQSEWKLNHINEVGTSVHDKMCHYTNHVLL